MAWYFKIKVQLVLEQLETWNFSWTPNYYSLVHRASIGICSWPNFAMESAYCTYSLSFNGWISFRDASLHTSVCQSINLSVMRQSKRKSQRISHGHVISIISSSWGRIIGLIGLVESVPQYSPASWSIAVSDIATGNVYLLIKCF